MENRKNIKWRSRETATYDRTASWARITHTTHESGRSSECFFYINFDSYLYASECIICHCNIAITPLANGLSLSLVWIERRNLVAIDIGHLTSIRIIPTAANHWEKATWNRMHREAGGLGNNESNGIGWHKSRPDDSCACLLMAKECSFVSFSLFPILPFGCCAQTRAGLDSPLGFAWAN